MANIKRDLVLKNIHNLSNHLKENLMSNLKLLENVGCHPYVVKITAFNNFGINLTVQISEDFDFSKSTAISSHVKKSNQNDQSTKLLDDFLNEKIKTIDPQSDIFLIKLFQKSQNYIEKHFDYIQNSRKKSPTKAKGITKKNDEESDPNSKKVSMKTAGDVVNRIQWDSEINKDYITVGYIDRFLGLKECSFNTFDWGDIVLAEYGALAIPEHRISYFKYKDEIIWDKKSRLDNFFGSTGSGQTIRDIVKRLENFEFQPQNEIASEQPESKQSNLTPDTPNYFISIPINSFEIKSNFYLLNSDLLEYNDEVENFLVPDTSFHLTLCTLRIDSVEEMDLVKQVLNESKEKIKDNFPICLNFRGLDQFYQKVLYVKCPSENLLKLKNLKEFFLTQLEEHNLNMAGNYYNFVPHLTVFKINSNSNNRNISVDDFLDQNLWKKYENFDFGEETVSQIQLCKMTNIMLNKIYPIEHEIEI
ncbi:leukocyte receptor cluster member 9 [Brachionus plicatilis]|uniref:Leukocyte receptor cluster member 9 n=1 Tax=Brachionus plicatilis TaxID=10195 RepID=A0A3M7PY09_BRAPC|nr:leukocyte receptor cluster member 9 [Brachionus plicatilis]